jgi:hypothetical protein
MIKTETTIAEAAEYKDSSSGTAAYRRYRAFCDAELMANQTGKIFYVWYEETAGWKHGRERPRAEYFWEFSNHQLFVWSSEPMPGAAQSLHGTASA